MKMIIMKCMILISSLIPLMKTPMSLGLMLLIQTFMSTIILMKMMYSSWMTFMMFLMLIGGLLILFLYMSSIASNEKFMTNFKMLMMSMLLIIPSEEMIMNNLINEKQNMITWTESISMSKMFNKNGYMITLIMFCFLLLTMISVTKIIKIYKGPLRATYE